GAIDLHPVEDHRAALRPPDDLRGLAALEGAEGLAELGRADDDRAAGEAPRKRTRAGLGRLRHPTGAADDLRAVGRARPASVDAAPLPRGHRVVVVAGERAQAGRAGERHLARAARVRRAAARVVAAGSSATGGFVAANLRAGDEE